jgi:hypothetical protein
MARLHRARTPSRESVFLNFDRFTCAQRAYRGHSFLVKSSHGGSHSGRCLLPECHVVINCSAPEGAAIADVSADGLHPRSVERSASRRSGEDVWPTSLGAVVARQRPHASEVHSAAALVLGHEPTGSAAHRRKFARISGWLSLHPYLRAYRWYTAAAGSDGYNSVPAASSSRPLSGTA